MSEDRSAKYAFATSQLILEKRNPFELENSAAVVNICSNWRAVPMLLMVFSTEFCLEVPSDLSPFSARAACLPAELKFPFLLIDLPNV